MLDFAYIQAAIFGFGVIAIIIAGIQDKKSRLAPAIYLAPTLIGFGINPILGLIGLISTILTLFFYKDEWNKQLGLADFLLFFTLLIALFNPITSAFVILISIGFLLDILLIQKDRDKAPLIWIFSKWIIITGILATIITLIV